MRKLLLLLVVGAAGFWFYETHLHLGPPFWSPLVMPDPVAWKQVTNDRSGATTTLVTLMDGDRWRTETRRSPSEPIHVSIFDGVNYAKSDATINVAEANPRPSLEANYAEMKRSSPARTDECDGRPCWVYTDGPDKDGLKGEIWIDEETRFPVLVTEWYEDGSRQDEHIHLLKSDFNILRTTCFNTNNLAPMMAPFLKQ